MELITKLNKLLSNLNVMDVKLHNYHYNIIGIDFYTTHKLLEAEYDKFHEWIDIIAEQIRIKDQLPLSNMKDYLANATLEEAKAKEISSKEIYINLLSDYEALAQEIIEVREISDEGLEEILNEILNTLNITIWFFRSFIK